MGVEIKSRRDDVPRRQTGLSRGGGSGSASTSDFRLIVMGNPQGGSFTFDLGVPDASDSGTLLFEEIEVDIPATQAEFRDDLATHSLLSTSNVNAYGTGGDLPAHEVTWTITLGEYRTADCEVRNEDASGLTGGTSPYLLFRRC